MNEKALFDSLEAIRKDLSEIKESISHLPLRRPALPPGANTTGRKGKLYSRRLQGGFRNPEIRAVVLKLRQEGQRYVDIASSVKKYWPDSPEKHPSKSAIHRFCVDARNGRLREFGIGGDP